MIFTIALCTAFQFDIAIVGASGNLGRELVHQSIVDYDANVLGLTSQNNIFYKPSRLDSFNSDNKKEKFESKNLVLRNYWSRITDDYEHIVFCTSAKPFQKDYSSELFNKFLIAAPALLKKYVEISSFTLIDVVEYAMKFAKCFFTKF